MQNAEVPSENTTRETSENEVSRVVAALREYSPEDVLRSSPDAEAFSEGFIDSAILVYGPRKSGTTLLQSLLDGGANLLMLPGEAKIKFLFEPRRESPYLLRYALQSGERDFSFERAKTGAAPIFATENAPHFPGLSPEVSSQLFDAPRYFQTLQKLHAEHPNHSYARASRSEKTQVSTEVSRHELRAEVAAFAACLRVREYSQGEAAPRFRAFAVKEVGGDSQKIVARWRKVLPQTQVVFLVRDPRLVVRSIVLDRRRKGIRLGFWQIIKQCEEAQNIVGAALGCKDCEVLSYEDLTRDTRGEMQRLCARLEIDFEEKLCAPTMLSQSAIVRTSSKKTQQVFSEKKNWRDDLLPHQRLAISLFHAIAPLSYALRRRAFVRYDALQKELQSRRAAE